MKAKLNLFLLSILCLAVLPARAQTATVTTNGGNYTLSVTSTNAAFVLSLKGDIDSIPDRAALQKARSSIQPLLQAITREQAAAAVLPLPTNAPAYLKTADPRRVLFMLANGQTNATQVMELRAKILTAIANNP